MGLHADTRCFSLRRVNPFQGIAALVRTPGGRAISIDGRHWQIQILAHPPRGLWTGGGEREELRYFRFGFWSAEEGTTRVPLNPILDAGAMVAESDRLIAEVRAATPALPFPIAAELEQWLLDPEGHPIALLATALGPDRLAEAGSNRWSAVRRGDTRSFASDTLSRRGVAERDASGRRHHVESLEQLIADAASREPATGWFRIEGESALALAPDGAPEVEQTPLPRSTFPPLTLRRHWPAAEAQALVDEYIAWLSPYLLTLPDLDDATRHGLEQAATHHALLVDDLWRLYPKIIDEGLIKQARVEARLRLSQAS